MKTSIPVLFIFLLLTGYSCKESVDPEAEKAAIIAVIEAEQEAYFEQDLEKMIGTWKQDTSSRKILSGRGHEDYIEIRGWTALYEENKKNLSLLPGALDGIQLTNSSIEIQLYTNTALVYHDAIWSGSFEDEEWAWVQKRILHLVKVDTAWKIDLMYMYNMPDETY